MTITDRSHRTSATYGGVSTGSEREIGPRHLWAAALVGVVAATVAYWRTYEWAGAVGIDTWAYAAWGQAIERGDVPQFYKSGTTPKPLAMLLGTFAALMPAHVAMLLVMSVALGGLAAGLFLAAARANGWAAAAAVGALIASVGFESMFELSDGVAAALVVASVASRRWLRVGFLVAAGVMRPEAWILAGIAGWMAEAEPRRRILAAVGSAVAAPVLWMAADVATMGDPLGTAHFLGWARTRKLGGVPVPTDSVADVAREFASLIWGTPLDAAVASAGIVGLVLIVIRRPRGLDAFPAIVAGVGALELFILAVLATNMYERYLLPFVLTMLGLGAGYLVGMVLGRVIIPVPAAAVIAAAALVVWGSQLQLEGRRERATRMTERVEASVGSLLQAVDCGRVGVLGNWRARDHLPVIAASARVPLQRLGVVRYDDAGRITNLERFAAIVRLHSGYASIPSDWTRYSTELSPLATRPGCTLPDTPLRIRRST
ncbi:MAG: hypothetical protein GEU78_01645 [Actinobacteria bacterium]|nr:hypothetical protein [Actinomycetota bacterium]